MGTKKQKETDIAKQRYKGPSATVAGLGEGALQGKVLTIGGFFLGGIIAAFFPKQSAALVTRIETGVENATHSSNAFKKILGDIGKMTLSIGKHTAEGFAKLGGKNFDPKKSKKIATIVDGAIITSTAGGILGIFTGGSRGIASAKAGKKQVKDLQAEVLNQREENNDLRKKLVDTQTQLEDERTGNAAKQGLLKVSNDAQHDIPESKNNWADSVTAQKDKAAETSLGL